MQTITFTPFRQSMRLVPNTERLAFKSSGNALQRWLQRQALAYLRWTGAVKDAYDEVWSFHRYTIDDKTFMQRLLRQRAVVFEACAEPRRLLIGSEDYADLMCCDEIMRYQHFSFDAELRMQTRRMMYPDIVGLKVEVCPWVRGAVVLP